jgi:hypothetical protein
MTSVIIYINNMFIIKATDIVLAMLVLVALSNAAHIGLALFVLRCPG